MIEKIQNIKQRKAGKSKVQETVISFPRCATGLLWSTSVSWILFYYFVKSHEISFSFFFNLKQSLFFTFGGKKQKPLLEQSLPPGVLYSASAESLCLSGAGLERVLLPSLEPLSKSFGCPCCAGGLSTRVCLSQRISINPLQ